MLQSLTSTESKVESLLTKWAEKNQVHEKNHLRLYSSSQAALTEVIVGLTKLFPHKKKVLIFPGGHPLIDDVTKFLSSEAFEITQITWESWEAQKDVLLKEDFLFALNAEDNYLTGEIFPFIAFQEEWNKARKFSLSISVGSYAGSKNLLEDKEPFRARILSLDESCHLSVLGSRMKKLSRTFIGSPKCDDSLLTVFGDLIDTDINDYSNLELNAAPLSEGYILLEEKPGCETARDRVCFRIPEVDSFALKQLMVEVWGEDVGPQILTGSLIEWGGVRPLTWVGHDKTEEIIALSLSLYDEKKAEITPLLLQIKKMMGLEV